MSEPYIKCGEVLKVLISEGTALLSRHGENTATAESGGEEFAFWVLTHFSGQKVYFPKFTTDAARKRFAVISDDVQASRQSAVEIVRKYGISMTVAYQIIKQTRDLAANSQDAHYVVKGVAIEACRMLLKHGVAPSDAVVAARGFAGVLVAKWGGQWMSFPRLETIKAQKRTGDIVRQYQSGVPCGDIARRYGLSFVRIYQIIDEFCRENGMEPPQRKKQKNALSALRRRILDVAKPYMGKDAEIYGLLESAAKAVDQAIKQFSAEGMTTCKKGGESA